MFKFFLIALGGALGSVARYSLQGFVQRLFADTQAATFPVGTLVVNVLGCFLIGVLSGMFAGPWLIREEYRIGLTVGILGGFTTFSTFGLESFNLVNDGQHRLALANLVLSYALGLLAVGIGYRLAERWLGV
jgi:fluoride exporter